MTRKNRGPLLSITAGLVAILLLFVVLLLHVFGANATLAEATADHASSPPAVAENPVTIPQTMIMPDGSTMDMGDMGPSTAGDSSTADPAGQTMTMPDGSTMDMGAMGGAIDWQVIGLILALVAACIPLGIALNEYLRRKMALGALVEQGATGE